MADQQQQPREPGVSLQDVCALAGIGCCGAGAYLHWGLSVGLMAGGGLLLCAVVTSRL